jgi:hypothetical protein
MTGRLRHARESGERLVGLDNSRNSLLRLDRAFAAVGQAKSCCRPALAYCQLSPVLPPGSFRQLKPAPEGRAGQLLHRWQPAGYPQRRHSSNIPRRGVTRTVVASSDLEPARDASRMRGGLPQMHEMKRHQGQSGFPTPVGSPRLRRSSPGARMVRHCGGLCYGRGIACYGRR